MKNGLEKLYGIWITGFAHYKRDRNKGGVARASQNGGLNIGEKGECPSCGEAPPKSIIPVRTEFTTEWI